MSPHLFIFLTFLLPVSMKVFENSKFFKNRWFFLSIDSWVSFSWFRFLFCFFVWTYKSCKGLQYKFCKCCRKCVEIKNFVFDFYLPQDQCINGYSDHVSIGILSSKLWFLGNIAFTCAIWSCFKHVCTFDKHITFEFFNIQVIFFK